ncbi:neuroglobin-like [Babylonia areolata]|uniref:neuroglobin-like n=1 Tax=Babylonia areolata TaxID=304850 RepID=UPI003FCF3916
MGSCWSMQKGASATKMGESGESSKELEDFLTPRESNIIHSSWIIIEQNRTKTGVYLFTRLFQLQASFKKMFKRLMTRSETGHFIIDWQMLESHADLVMGVLGKVVANLENSTQLSAELVQLGERHHGYHLHVDMVWLMWPALRDTLKHALVTDFTLETELAWKHLFEYVASKMELGIKRGMKHDSASSTQGVPPPFQNNTQGGGREEEKEEEEEEEGGGGGEEARQGGETLIT